MSSSLLKRENFYLFISFISIVFAFFALCQTHSANSPKIVVTQETAYTYSRGGSVEDRTISLLRFFFSNTGGRAITLKKILRNQNEIAIQGFDQSGSLVNLERSVYLFYPDSLTKSRYDITKYAENPNVIDLKDGYLVNKIIEPGAVIQIDIGVISYGKWTKDIETILLSLIAEFSNNARVPIQTEFDAHVRRYGR